MLAKVVQTGNITTQDFFFKSNRSFVSWMMACSINGKLHVYPWKIVQFSSCDAHICRYIHPEAYRTRKSLFEDFWKSRFFVEGTSVLFSGFRERKILLVKWFGLWAKVVRTGRFTWVRFNFRSNQCMWRPLAWLFVITSLLRQKVSKVILALWNFGSR